MAISERLVETNINHISKYARKAQRNDERRAQRDYNSVMAYLHPVGSSRRDLSDNPPLYEPKGLFACLKLAALDSLEERRLPEAVVEDWDEMVEVLVLDEENPFPRGTYDHPEAMVKEIDKLYKLGRHPGRNKG